MFVTLHDVRAVVALRLLFLHSELFKALMVFQISEHELISPTANGSGGERNSKPYDLEPRRTEDVWNTMKFFYEMKRGRTAEKTRERMSHLPYHWQVIKTIYEASTLGRRDKAWVCVQGRARGSHGSARSSSRVLGARTRHQFGTFFSVRRSLRDHQYPVLYGNWLYWEALNRTWCFLQQNNLHTTVNVSK